MFSHCAIYLHKAFYLGHLLVSNFFPPQQELLQALFQQSSVCLRQHDCYSDDGEGGREGEKLPDLH